MCFRYLFSSMLMAWASVVCATDIISVRPVTDKILMIHFDEGDAFHHKRGQPRADEYVVVTPLNIGVAMAKDSYSLQSNDDPNYLTPLHPQDVGRKSKPTEFAIMCQQYNNGCINTDPDHVKEHWLYLFLPHALVDGKTYTLFLDELLHDTEIAFTFDSYALHSETVHVNNIGYSAYAPAKYAYLYHWMGDKGGLDLSEFAGRTFQVVDVNTQTAVFEGKIALRKKKNTQETSQLTDTPGGNFSGADVYECDFSEFIGTGEYKIVVPGIGSSFPFKISGDVFREPFFWVMKGLYHNRSGSASTMPFTTFTRPAPHHPQETPGFNGRLKYSSFRSFDLSTQDGQSVDKASIESKFKGVLNETYGWYQDAGDWDGYYTHSHIPAYLLFLYEMGKDKFTDNELQIPESGNGIPDIVDEASWLIRYFYRARKEILTKGYGTGGVPGARVFGDLWGSDERQDGTTKASWEDTDRDWYVLGEDVWTTYKYAALAAHLAYVLNADDPEGVDWKAEAISAYAWASTHSIPDDEKERHGIFLRHIRMYAAASLFRLTGEPTYYEAFAMDFELADEAIDQNRQDHMFASWMYLLSGNQWLEQRLSSAVRSHVNTSAEKYLGSAEKRACRWGGDFTFPMLVGQGSTPMVAAGLFGAWLNQDNMSLFNRYNTYIHTTADYFLGCNPLNITWISGLAERSPQGLFYMDWWYRDKADPKNVQPVIPGVVPYGPWRFENLGDLGWWNPNWAYSDAQGNPRIYPDQVTDWPGHERWFDMRVSPLSSEFTIHQNTVIAAFVYGFLTEGSLSKPVDGVITSIDISEGKEWIDVFPNPATDKLIVRERKAALKRVVMYDSGGQKVKAAVRDSVGNQWVCDVGDLMNGLYVVKVWLPNKGTISVKVAISR